MKKSLFISIFYGLITLGAISFISCIQQSTDEINYTVKYHTNRSTAPESFTVKPDTVLTAEELPDLYEEGCVFNGWYDGDTLAKAGEYKVTHNVILEASWKKNRNGENINDGESTTTYSVVHYLQKLTGVGYVQVADYNQSFIGKSGTLTDAVSLEIEGFIPKEITQEEIASDGSTIIKVYYDRKEIVINFDTDGGNIINSITGLYGAHISNVEIPVKDGFEFIGWDPELPSKFKNNITLKAKWKNNYVSGINFTFIQNEIELTFDRTCITAASGYSSYKWFINQKELTEKGNTIYLPCKSGFYDVSVIVKDSKGNLLSTSGTVTLNPENTNKEFVKVTGSLVYRGTEITPGLKDYKYFDYFSDYYSVLLSDFYICSHEVTQDEYEKVMKSNPSSGNSTDEFNERQECRPVENISWYEAIAYCNSRSVQEGLNPCYRINDRVDFYETIPTVINTSWNNIICDTSANGYRLPTEVEWEYAARGGYIGFINEKQNKYSGSDTLGDVAWYKSNSSDKTHQSSQKLSNLMGLYDFSGNVSEWCFDIYSKEKNYSDSTGINRVIRGGSYEDIEDNCKLSYRKSSAPTIKYKNVGLRLVRSSL